MALRFLLRFPAFSQKEQNGPFFTFSWLFQTFLPALTSASRLASLASPTAAQRAFGRLRWLPAVLGTPSNAEVSERPAAAEVAPGGFRCSARAGHTPAIISRACCAFVPLITATCVPRRAQAAFDVHEQPTSRAGRALQERRHVEVSAGSRRWVCWGGSGSAGIPVGGVRESRDAREFTRGNSPISPK